MHASRCAYVVEASVTHYTYAYAHTMHIAYVILCSCMPMPMRLKFHGPASNPTRWGVGSCCHLSWVVVVAVAPWRRGRGVSCGLVLLFASLVRSPRLLGALLSAILLSYDYPPPILCLPLLASASGQRRLLLLLLLSLSSVTVHHTARPPPAARRSLSQSLLLHKHDAPDARTNLTHHPLPGCPLSVLLEKNSTRRAQHNKTTHLPS